VTIINEKDKIRNAKGDGIPIASYRDAELGMTYCTSDGTVVRWVTTSEHPLLYVFDSWLHGLLLINRGANPYEQTQH
jgi:hypothetical protein